MPRVYGSARKRTGERRRAALWRIVLRLAALFAPSRLLIWAVIIAGIIHVWGAPYLRVQYVFRGPRDYPVYTWCDYWGYQPFETHGPDCPVIVFRAIGTGPKP
jgi:hypothetical protein